GPPARAFAPGAFLTKDAILRTDRRQRIGDELLGGAVSGGDDVGDGGLRLCLEPGGAHAPRQTGSVVHQRLSEMVIGVVDVRDDEGLDDRVEHLLRHRGVTGRGGRILCLSHTSHCAHCRVDLRTMQPDVSSDLKDLEGTLTTIERVLDLDELDSRARELEDQAADASLWDDTGHAQQVTSELSRVQAKRKKTRELLQRLEALPVLYNMAEEEAAGDPAEAEDAVAMANEERSALRAAIESLEITTMLSGEYDQREA